MAVRKSKNVAADMELPNGAPLGALQAYIGIPLRLAHRAILTQVNELLADVELTPVEFALLAVIDANRDAMFGQIGAILGIKKSNFAPIVARMQKRGLVKRIASQVDARRNHLSLTAAGQGKLARGTQVHDELERHLVANLGRGAHDELVRLLHTLADVPLLKSKRESLDARAKKFGVQ